MGSGQIPLNIELQQDDRTVCCSHTVVCGIGATIRMGRESWCLPYAGFFFYLFSKFLNFTLKKGEKKINFIIVASIDMWQSYFAQTCCQIHFTLFCRKFTFVAINALFWVK